MRLLVFQHIDCEHPGSLRQSLKADNIEWQAVNLHRGDAIPDLDAYDALWVMGGPMDVWDTREYPWLIEEKAAIRHWVGELDKPFLGRCLGHQLLADAMGGTCGPQKPPEIGILDIELTAAGQSDALFTGLPTHQKCLQWHSVCVTQPPADAAILARSRNCAIQAMRLGKRAWSMQYHVEIEADTIDNWADVPAYNQALMDTIGEAGLNEMRSAGAQYMTQFNKCAGQLYHNFVRAMAV